MIYRAPFYMFSKVIFLLFSDFFAVALSFYLSLVIRYYIPIFVPFWAFPDFFPENYIVWDIWFLPMILFLVSISYQLYQKRRPFWEELLFIWKAVIFSSLIGYVLLFNFDEILPFASRFVILIYFTLLLFFLPLCRLLIKKILFVVGFWKKPVSLVSDPDRCAYIPYVVNAFKKDFYQGFVITDIYCSKSGEAEHIVFDNDRSKISNNSTVFYLTETLSQNNKTLIELYSRCRRVYLIPQGFVGLINSGVQYLFSERMFLVRIENQLNSLYSNVLKNLMDYFLGIMILLLISPLLFIIALLVKVTSKGSVFYKHERIGKNRKPFKMWKFRTMYPDADIKLQNILASDPERKAEWDQYFKLSNDPRITPIGSFLRKYSLDELPQLFNVLFGNMSLIGPRPFIKGELEGIRPELVPMYSQVKPGLTGLWQVSGRSDTDRLERLDIDVWYLQNWNPALDLLILLNTPLAVLTARGAR